ncbi:MAG: hypothetical protein ACK5MT_19990 [Actinomycetales bacterium]
MSVRSIVEAQLERLESHWHRLGAPVASMLAPGLSDQQMDDIVGPTPYVLNDELRAWWGWHDGVAPYTADRERPYHRSIWRGNHQFPGLAHAVELTKPAIHDIGRELGPEWGERWGSWIIFLRQGSDYLAGPGPVNPQDPSEIMHYEAAAGLDQPLMYVSLSEMLATWLGALLGGP